jgi:hypothetical protein
MVLATNMGNSMIIVIAIAIIILTRVKNYLKATNIESR